MNLSHFFFTIIAFLLQLTQTIEEFLLDSIEDIAYLSDKDASRVDGIDDAVEFQNTVRAMDIVGITEAERNCVWRTLSAIMKMGQMKFTQDRTDQAQMPDDTMAAMVCKLLGLPLGEFIRAMLKPRIKVICLLISFSISNHVPIIYYVFLYRLINHIYFLCYDTGWPRLCH